MNFWNRFFFMRNILRKVLYFKIREINLRTINVWETKYQAKQTETKSQSKIFGNQANWNGVNGGQSSLFSDGLWKINFTRDYLSN